LICFTNAIFIIARLANVNRREALTGAGAAVLLGAVSPRTILAIDWGSTFGTVLGAVGVGLFPGAAAALGGFELIRLLGNGADLAHNANDLVAQTQSLESHIDSVLNGVASTLKTVQSFVEDCDKAIQDIEGLVKQLPADLATAFSAVEAQKAFARLRADCANMTGYLQSKGSIAANHLQIQSLAEKIVGDISSVDALAPNLVQSMMQIVPGITTWVQGYTAYNLLLSADQRGANPWDHPVVSAIAGPRISDLLAKIGGASAEQDHLSSSLPLEAGVLYQYDGSAFKRSATKFAVSYDSGDIDNGYYYTIWPDGVSQPQPLTIAELGDVQPGDFCWLRVLPVPFAPGHTGRVWAVPPLHWMLHPVAQPVLVGAAPFAPGGAPLFPAAGAPLPPEYGAAFNAAAAYNRLVRSTLRDTVALSQLTQGLDIFQNAVKTKLEVDDQTKGIWMLLPKLS
jgi:hypothetical protein